MKRAESDRPSSGQQVRYSHINPKRGNIITDHLSPVIIMKKMKLGPSDASGFASVTDFLPELTDDDAEMETQQKKQAAGDVPNEEVSFIQTMTQQERNDHVQQCLEMSSENKINLKNAFALQLIDCFSFLQKKKDFSAMACTLDAGTKIYSCRVDALHQQVRKLADEFAVREEKRTDDGGDKVDGDKRVTKELRKGRKNKFIASAEALTRKMKGKDPKDQYLKFEGLPGAIMSGARIDATDLSLSLERYLPFWPNRDSYKPLKAQGMVSLPEIKIFRENTQAAILESPRTSEPDQSQSNMDHSWDGGENADNTFEVTPISEVAVSIDLPVRDQSTGNAGDGDKAADDPEEHNDEVGEVEVGVVATAMERLREEAEAEGAVNKAPSRADALKILFDLKSEYDYLNVRNYNYWSGPEFWKRPRMRAEHDQEKRKDPSKKKDPAEIVYDFEDQEERGIKLGKKATRLADKTVGSWRKKKTTLPENLKVELSSFFNLFHVENCGGTLEESGLVQKPTSFVDVLESFEKVDDITDDTTDPFGSTHGDSSGNQDALDATFYEAASGRSASSNEPCNPLDSTFYDAGPSNIGELGKIIRVEVSSNVTSDYESSMVPAPKMVNVLPIKYSTRPIRVDMHHLKRVMLEVITAEVEKQNARLRKQGLRSGADEDGSAAERPGARFRDVLQGLPQKLERRTREDLSVAIAFTAVLSLANENSLQLLKCESGGDFVVRFPDFRVPLTEGFDAENRFKRLEAK